MYREVSKEGAERCITHHWGCDCREYQFQKMKEALEIISVVAEVWHDIENPEEALIRISKLARRTLNE